MSPLCHRIFVFGQKDKLRNWLVISHPQCDDVSLKNIYKSVSYLTELNIVCDPCIGGLSSIYNLAVKKFWKYKDDVG